MVGWLVDFGPVVKQNIMGSVQWTKVAHSMVAGKHRERKRLATQCTSQVA
jgi:hypothetical protein